MERKIYEITFWARQNKGEQVEEKLLSLLEKFNFELIKKIPLKTKELAYPIDKETSGELGTIYFYGLPEKIEELKNKVKQIKEILRFIILVRRGLKIEKINGGVIKTSQEANLINELK